MADSVSLVVSSRRFLVVFGSNPPSGVYSEEAKEVFAVGWLLPGMFLLFQCVSERNHIPTRTRKNPGRADIL